MTLVRMADMAARHGHVAERVEALVVEVLRSGRYVGGPYVERAQVALAEHFGWKHAVGVNSGTDALIYALYAAGVRPGDEVIVPAVTFFASAGAVCRVGAIPVIADVRGDLPLLDPENLPISSKTRAVMAVHLFGEPCVLPTLDVPIVDDSAQTAGSDPPCKLGEIAAVSFYPTKTLGAAGDGGCVFTDDIEVMRKLKLLTHHGMPTPYFAERVDGVVGANSRLDAIQAAILTVHLSDMPRRVFNRRKTAAIYDRELPPDIRRLPRSPGHPVHQYVVQLPETVGREGVMRRLADQGVESAIYYPCSLSAQPALRDYARPTPNADAFCASCLALPVHEALTEAEVGRVVEAVGRAV